MIVRVHPASGVPIYLQIESQVKQAIAAQAIHEDDSLPPVRKLAAEIRVNPNTVARAYQNLERDGVIRTVQGGGCYGNGHAPRLRKPQKIPPLKPLAMHLAVEARQLLLPREDAQRLLEESFNYLERE